MTPMRRNRHARPDALPRRARKAAGLALLVALAVVGASAGCGLRADERPQPIPRDRLDDRLFQEGGDAPAGSRPARIYVLSSQGGEQQLVSVAVQVTGSERYERAVLDTLLAWTPPSDRGGNLRLSSLIPYGTKLRDVHLDGDVLTVDLANLTIEGPGQAQALAQIVFTATEIPGIMYVRFAIDGKPVAVPLDENNTTAGARLTRDDFAKLSDPPTTSTTSAPVAAPPPTTAAPVPETTVAVGAGRQETAGSVPDAPAAPGPAPASGLVPSGNVTSAEVAGPAGTVVTRWRTR
jgi:hypothetical protein